MCYSVIKYVYNYFPLQITYLIDKAFNVGKGANTIISMLHHSFQHHGVGETVVHLHMNSCSGQNKNRFMMQYLMWCVLTGLHEEIKLSFLPVGPTKFEPDWCCGMAKQPFRCTRVDCLNDIANSMSSSSFMNVPQLVGTLDGTCYVPTYNWSEYFEQHTIKTALKGITKLHHFHFDAKSPGTVYVKERSSDSE